MADGAGRSIKALAVSRRGVVAGGLMLAGGAAVPALGAVTSPRKALPQIAFHADRLYLDRSGGVEAYVPPAGLRSLEGLSEEALRRLVYHP